MKTATITVDVHGNGGFGDETLRKLSYTEEVHSDYTIARTLLRAADLIHPGAVVEYTKPQRNERLNARHARALAELRLSEPGQGNVISRAQHALNALNILLEKDA